MALLKSLLTVRGLKYYLGIPALTLGIEYILLHYTNLNQDNNLQYFGALTACCPIGIALLDEFLNFTGVQ